MSAIGSMNLEIAYYNAKLALWEPVLEPIVSVQPDGSSITKRWDLMVTVQKNAASDFGSAFVSPRCDLNLSIRSISHSISIFIGRTLLLLLY